MRRLAMAIAAAPALLCSSCITINHKTEEPIKLDPVTVNLKMDVDVVYHSSGKTADERRTEREIKETAERQRNRLEQITKLKDDGIIGETSEGLVEVVPEKYSSARCFAQSGNQSGVRETFVESCILMLPKPRATELATEQAYLPRVEKFMLRGPVQCS